MSVCIVRLHTGFCIGSLGKLALTFCLQSEQFCLNSCPSSGSNPPSASNLPLSITHQVDLFFKAAVSKPSAKPTGPVAQGRTSFAASGLHLYHIDKPYRFYRLSFPPSLIAQIALEDFQDNISPLDASRITRIGPFNFKYSPKNTLACFFSQVSSIDSVSELSFTVESVSLSSFFH